MEDEKSIGQQIERLTKEANKSKILEVPGSPPGVYYLVGPDGEAEMQWPEPAPHHEKLDTPAELFRFAKDHSGNEADKSAVFYNEEAIRFVYSLSDRQDSAACPLVKSPAYKWLERPAGPMSQRDFIRLLRIQFRGCIPQESGILNIIRNLKFSNAGDVGANIQHGRESIGRSLQAQITGEASVPEELRLNIQVFENHPFITQATCAIETYPQEQQLQLTPYPLEVRRAMDAAMADLAIALSPEDGEFLLYRGQP